jgi:coenzyme F420 hydrogenase subunit beta
MSTIAKVVENGLCVGCGTCVGLCPDEAITIQKSNGLFLPLIDFTKCSTCGLCIRVCPGYALNFDNLNLFVFKRKPTNAHLGNYLECRVGHATTDSRYSSSSGGIVTELLIFALESGLIDGALVVKMDKMNPLEPVSFIARTKEDLISASKSKYCPVSLNRGLKQILSEEGKFAVVGLPCHIHGIRKAEAALGCLKTKIVLHVGLMCSHTINFYGTDFILDLFHVRKDDVTALDYRGHGWPGALVIKHKNCSDIEIPYVGSWHSYWPVFSSFFFTPERCLSCPDQVNELADISVGDAWLPEFKHEQCGESVIVTRTSAAEDVFSLAIAKGVISVMPVSPEKIVLSQATPLQFKKTDLGGRLSFFKSLGLATPHLIPKPLSSHHPIILCRNLFATINSKLSSKKSVRKLLRYVPLPLFRLYYGFYKLLSMI